MSLRNRLTLFSVLFLALSLLVIGVGLYFYERTILLNGVRDDLLNATQRFQEQYTVAKKPLEGFFDSANLVPTTLFTEEFDSSPIAVAIYKNTGERLAASQGFLGGDTKTLAADRLAAVLANQTVVGELQLRNGRLLQVMSPLTFNRDVVGVLVVSQSLRTVDRALDTLIWVLCVAGGIMLLITTAGIAGITRSALLPIDMIASTAEQIVRAEDLSRRIPVANPHDELGRLATITNDLLARMEGLFNTQRRLTADVSHELRTPLAAMRGNLEVLRRGAMKNPELLAESLSDLEREVSRLTRLVNDLLLLAQSEAGVQIRQEPVELDTLVLEVFREMRPLAEHIKLQIGSEDQATVIGDRDRLKQALLNLTYNAVQHTPSEGTVTLNLMRVGREAAISVNDTGEGITPDALPHIFERFYRADRARVRKGGGAGIGLAIVKWIAEAHRGTVEVRSTLGEGSTFTLWLPLATSITDRLTTRALAESPSKPLTPESVNSGL
ncbi:MAG: HAMP domain-containing histidine kinase [Herpetosiphonaceae bacterium]|nr:HAMP domain-containing histidine kinase [Herpetosiphonaceae bacterium]